MTNDPVTDLDEYSGELILLLLLIYYYHYYADLDRDCFADEAGQGDDLLIEAVQLLQGQLGDVLPLQQLAVPGSENKR